MFAIIKLRKHLSRKLQYLLIIFKSLFIFMLFICSNDFLVNGYLLDYQSIHTYFKIKILLFNIKNIFNKKIFKILDMIPIIKKSQKSHQFMFFNIF